jgi:sugar O-acyltransferase (sialic acid O-acetyltransferase NeuD family)
MGGAYRIAIYGCGGHARSIINVLHENTNDIPIILVDENACDDEIIMGCMTVQKYEPDEDTLYILGIGDNKKRSQLYHELLEKSHGVCIPIISKYACVGQNAQIGKGTFVAPNTYIGPSAIIGDNTIINTGSIIEHETIIGNSAHIAPNSTVCGRAKIGNNVFCGAGSTIVDKISICDNVTIGAGAVVVGDIMEAGTYVGVPAKKIN